MDDKTIQKIIMRCGYGESTLDTNESNTFYFRTNDYKYIIKAVMFDNHIEIYRATEDFYEKYAFDWYDYDLDAKFTFAELVEYGWMA